MYKPHPRFLTQNLSKKVRLIQESLRYLISYSADLDWWLWKGSLYLGPCVAHKSTKHLDSLPLAMRFKKKSLHNFSTLNFTWKTDIALIVISFFLHEILIRWNSLIIWGIFLHYSTTTHSTGITCQLRLIIITITFNLMCKKIVFPSKISRWSICLA